MPFTFTDVKNRVTEALTGGTSQLGPWSATEIESAAEAALLAHRYPVTPSETVLAVDSNGLVNISTLNSIDIVLAVSYPYTSGGAASMVNNLVKFRRIATDRIGVDYGRTAVPGNAQALVRWRPYQKINGLSGATSTNIHDMALQAIGYAGAAAACRQRAIDLMENRTVDSDAVENYLAAAEKYATAFSASVPATETVWVQTEGISLPTPDGNDEQSASKLETAEARDSIVESYQRLRAIFGDSQELRTMVLNNYLAFTGHTLSSDDFTALVTVPPGGGLAADGLDDAAAAQRSAMQAYKGMLELFGDTSSLRGVLFDAFVSIANITVDSETRTAILADGETSAVFISLPDDAGSYQ